MRQQAHQEQQRYAEPEKPKKKKKGRVKRFFIGILVILILLIIGAGVVWFTPSLKKPAIRGILKSPFGPALVRIFVGNNYDSYVRDKEWDDDDVIINSGAATPKGNLTFAMIGVDARDEELTIGTMADSMIIVNVTPEGNIRMASVYRDTYLLSHTKDGREVISKANSAYYRGGPFGTINLFEGKLYIQTGKVKDVSKQIHANPKAEICAFKDGKWLRVAATLVEDDRVQARQSMLDAYPSLQAMYSADDGNTEVFYLKDATATFSSFTAAPETVKF